MPVDNRRLPVPESSYTPYSIQKNPPEEVKLLSDEGKRTDGRRPNQVRPIFLKTGVVSQAKGSAYVEMNQTKVICSVYGPREVTKREDFSMKGQLNCEIKYSTFSSQLRRQHQQDAQEKQLSVILQQALEPCVQLEKFPKSRMDVFVIVIQDDGSALSGAISASSVALSNAGIEMYDLVVGCSLRLCGDMSLLDPCKSEEYTVKNSKNATNSGSMTVGLMPSLHQVVAVVQDGHVTCELAMEGLKKCVEGCQRLFPVLQESLIQSVKDRVTVIS